jgi:hypothetical protein
MATSNTKLGNDDRARAASIGEGEARRPAAAIAAFALLLLVSGCASMQARKSLEHVAKDWCDTVRASQILCVYPLTEDLRPGDVFLVQVPIQTQVDLYRQRGFLPLDDHVGRLKVSYGNMYFDSYWKDEFGQTPHPRPARPSPPAAGGATQPPDITKTEILAPRAAFPTYSFEATSSGGLSLAIPVQGVPLGLGYLAADRVAGTITIADARTYAVDAQSLYEALQAWAQQPAVRRMLSDTLRQVGEPFLYLRVVSRIYLTGGVVVSLTKDMSRGAQAQVGGATPPATPTLGATAVEHEKALLDSLNAQAAELRTQLPGTGAIKFASASASSVSLSESFDRPLVIGYLGFDVPFYSGGVLGAPIPTFERLEEHTLARVSDVTKLSLEQSRYKLEEEALEMLAAKNIGQALHVARLTADELGAKDFSGALREIKDAEQAMRAQRPDWASSARQALSRYKAAAVSYVSASGASGPNYGRYSDAFTTAYNRRNEPQ